MPIIDIRRVQLVNDMSLATLVRAINYTVEYITSAINENFRRGYPQIDSTFIVSATHIIWLPQEKFEVNAISVKSSSGTASMTPRINGTAMGVVGGVPITATTTATRYEINAANLVDRLDTVDMVISGLGPGANVVSALEVRRMG